MVSIDHHDIFKSQSSPSRHNVWADRRRMNLFRGRQGFEYKNDRVQIKITQYRRRIRDSGEKRIDRNGHEEASTRGNRKGKETSRLGYN